MKNLLARFDHLGLLAGMLLILGAPAGALASSITVLTEEEGASEALVAQFYTALRAQIELHPDYQLDNVPRQDRMEVMLALGCTELDASCSAILQEVTGSDLLAWTSFVEGEEGWVATLHLWNLSEGRMVSERETLVPPGERARRDRATLMSRSLLYAETQSLTLASEPSGASVRINGEDRGETPLTLEGLPIGVLAVELDLEGFRTTREEVVVDIGDNEATIALSSASTVRDRTAREPREPREPRERDGDFPPPALGYTLLGSGGALILGGVVMGVVTRGTQSDFDELVADPGFDLAQAETLRDRGQRQATLTNVFLISGGVLAGTGAVFTVLAHRKGAEAVGADVQSRSLTLEPRIGVGALGADLRLRF